MRSTLAALLLSAAAATPLAPRPVEAAWVYKLRPVRGGWEAAWMPPGYGDARSAPLEEGARLALDGRTLTPEAMSRAVQLVAARQGETPGTVWLRAGRVAGLDLTTRD